MITKHARLAAANAVKKTLKRITPEMKATRQKLGHDALVAHIRAVVAEFPDTTETAELEHAYWVGNIATSRFAFRKAWVEATTATPAATTRKPKVAPPVDSEEIDPMTVRKPRVRKPRVKVAS